MRYPRKTVFSSQKELEYIKTGTELKGAGRFSLGLLMFDSLLPFKNCSNFNGFVYVEAIWAD